MKEMTKKEIRKSAEEKIKSGKTQQETFDEIKAIAIKVKPETIAKIIRFIPSIKTRITYKTPPAGASVSLVSIKYHGK